MGIINLNKAVCDRCGRSQFSYVKQSAFLAALKKQGWEGTISNLLCPSCRETYAGKLTGIVSIEKVKYARIENRYITVYIDLKEFGGGSVSGLAQLKAFLAENKGDPNAIPYYGTAAVRIGEKKILRAHWANGLSVVSKEKLAKKKKGKGAAKAKKA